MPVNKVKVAGLTEQILLYNTLLNVYSYLIISGLHRQHYKPQLSHNKNFASETSFA